MASQTMTENGTETREDIPLKSGAKATNCCSEECLGGSKFVNIAFGTLTAVITLALLVQIHYGDYQVTPHGSVATDSLECSKIGTTVLKRGGNAVDAAIASAFCLAVAAPHLTSLDGEGQLLIYSHRTRFVPNVVDFSGPHVQSEHLPRLVLGLAYVHQQYASLGWKELVIPAANLAVNGFLISRVLVQSINSAKAHNLYGRVEAGQMLRLPELGETLLNIANIPEEELYSYVTATNQPIQTQAIKFSFYNNDIYVPNTPSIGPLLLVNLQDIKKYNFTEKDADKPEFVYRIAETTQIIYDELNVTRKFHRGTSTNVAVIDLNDNYVSLVTGMSGLFGSGELNSGYVLDNKPTDRHSTRLPLIITDGNVICGRRIVFGANDIDIASQLIASLIITNENATQSIESPRFHMLNGTIGIEESHTPFFNEDTLQYLETLTSSPILVNEPYFSSNIVEKLKDDLSSHSDSRGGGIASRF